MSTPNTVVVVRNPHLNLLICLTKPALPNQIQNNIKSFEITDVFKTFTVDFSVFKSKMEFKM